MTERHGNCRAENKPECCQTMLMIGSKNAQKHKKGRKKIKREGKVTSDKGREKTVRPQISQHFINRSISADPVKKIKKTKKTKETVHEKHETHEKKHEQLDCQ